MFVCGWIGILFFCVDNIFYWYDLFISGYVIFFIYYIVKDNFDKNDIVIDDFIV